MLRGATCPPDRAETLVCRNSFVRRYFHTFLWNRPRGGAGLRPNWHVDILIFCGCFAFGRSSWRFHDRNHHHRLAAGSGIPIGNCVTACPRVPAVVSVIIIQISLALAAIPRSAALMRHALPAFSEPGLAGFSCHHLVRIIALYRL